MTQRIDPTAPPPLDPEVTTRGTPRSRAARARLPVTVTPAMLEGAPEFAPGPTGSTRYDGWTYPRQRAFLKALAQSCVVRRAADAVGMSAEGAYRLRRTPGAEDFARAWDEALTVVRDTLHDVALDRAIHGVTVPIVRDGAVVAERTHYDNRLLGLLLRAHDPARFDPRARDAAARARAEEEERRRGGEGAKARLIAKLTDMRARLREDPDFVEGVGIVRRN